MEGALTLPAALKASADGQPEDQHDESEQSVRPAIVPSRCCVSPRREWIRLTRDRLRAYIHPGDAGFFEVFPKETAKWAS